MADIEQGDFAKVILDSNDAYRVVTSGTATVQVLYGAPSGTTTITAGSQTFGPYGANVALRVSAVSGTCSYRIEQNTPIEFDASGVIPAGAARDAVGEAAAALFPKPGRLTCFLGDSITNGSAASNFAYSFTKLVQDAVGGLVCRNDYIEAGVAGETSAQALARLQLLYQLYDIGHVHVQVGTNDAGQGVSAGAFLANIRSIVLLSKSRGSTVSVGTVPPRGSSASLSIVKLTNAYNVLLRLLQRDIDFEIADVNAVIVDQSTGYLLSACDSGDGVHPNNYGHQLMSHPVAKAMLNVMAYGSYRRGVIKSILSSGSGLISADPLNARASVIGSGWYEQPGGTGTAPTYSLVSDSSSELAAGRWAQMSFDATASGGTRRLATAITTGFSVGDKLLLSLQAQIEDVSGNWGANVASGSSVFGVSVLNQSAAAIFNLLGGRSPGLIGESSNVFNFGSSAFVFTVPDGVTQLLIWHSLALPTGSSAILRIGCNGLLNLTTMGLSDVINDGNIATNT